MTIPDRPSIADGIQGNIDLQTITFEIICKYIDDVVLVSEESIRAAMGHLLYREKLLTEGSAAATLAAAVEGKVAGSGPIVAVISGGNVDFKYFSRIKMPGRSPDVSSREPRVSGNIGMRLQFGSIPHKVWNDLCHR